MTDMPTHIAERLNRTDQKIDGHEERLTQLEKNEAGMAQWRMSTTDTLKGIQGDTKWIVRLVIASVIGAVLTMLYQGGIH